MPAETSFYYAIFKKLQAATGNMYALGQEHFDTDASTDLAGGFSLKSTEGPFSFFGALSPAAPNFGIGLVPGLHPLNPNSTVPAESPLFVMLNTSLGPPGNLPMSVDVAGQPWPVMPPPFDGTIDNYPNWKEFNAAAPRLIDAFSAWITKGKLNDSPKNAPLTFAALGQTPPAAFPNLKTPQAILFVASMAGDDGRRHGDHGTPDVPLDHVPAHFWNTSQIFLTDAAGFTMSPAHLKSGEEYQVAAIIGNSGNTFAGRLPTPPNPPKIHVLGDALAFNTFMSPNVPLPSLSNLDPASANPTYEQYTIRPKTYDVVGFRFNVDAVFAGLLMALTNANIDLGGLTPEQWLQDSHPCVKIRITSGETDNIFKPDGGAPLTLNSSPRKDRHIAQRNLAPFEISMMGAKKIQWKTFIVSQAGAGVNELSLDHALPADSFRVFLAMTQKGFDRFVTKGGRMRGFEAVRDVASKPFPEAVILRQTAKDARLDIAAHASEPFLGMALGIEWDPARIKTQRFGDVSVIHGAQGEIVGGFTLRLKPAR